MLEITNRDLFGKVVAQAITDANAKVSDAKLLKRWINAIAKATRHIEEGYAYMHWDNEHNSMLIKSENSNEIYQAGGSCECRAFGEQTPCWHRAAARIWRNYLRELDGEKFTVKTFAGYEPMSYRGGFPVGEKCGGINI